MAGPSDMVARTFAGMVARPERLKWLATGWRRGRVLGTIFRQMPRRLDREKVKGVDAVVDWKIRGAPDGGVDHYQLKIKDGKGRVSRRPKGEARATLEMDDVDFLRLAGGAAQGPELFMAGKVHVDGDLMFAATLASMFRVPKTAD
jgi:putative sterol carrier protein